MSLLCRFQKGVIFSRALSRTRWPFLLCVRLGYSSHFAGAHTTPKTSLNRERIIEIFFLPKKNSPSFFFFFFFCLSFRVYRVACFDTLNNTKSNIRVWKKLFLSFWTQEDFLSKSFETFFKGDYALLVLVLTPRADK